MFLEPTLPFYWFPHSIIHWVKMLLYIQFMFVEAFWPHFLVSESDVWNMGSYWPGMFCLCRDHETLIGKLIYPRSPFPTPAFFFFLVWWGWGWEVGGYSAIQKSISCPNHLGPCTRKLGATPVHWNSLKLFKLTSSKPAWPVYENHNNNFLIPIAPLSKSSFARLCLYVALFLVAVSNK